MSLETITSIATDVEELGRRYDDPDYDPPAELSGSDSRVMRLRVAGRRVAAIGVSVVDGEPILVVTSLAPEPDPDPDAAPDDDPGEYEDDEPPGGEIQPPDSEQ